MKLLTVVLCTWLSASAGASAQTVADSTYLSLTDHGPVPLRGMAELTNRVVYPEMAVRAGISGIVFVMAFVNEGGRVDSAMVVKGVHELLDSAAVQAVRATAFRPGLYGGRPVKALVTIPVRFSFAK